MNKSLGYIPGFLKFGPQDPLSWRAQLQPGLDTLTWNFVENFEGKPATFTQKSITSNADASALAVRTTGRFFLMDVN